MTNAPPVTVKIENPFATRFTRPGELPYVFCADDSLDAVLRRFAGHRRRGAIVGPHGSGKSTLLAELLPRIEASGLRTRVVTLHDGQRSLPPGFATNPQADEVLVVDGYEQLGWPARWGLHRAVRRGGAGLLVTAHCEVRQLPTLVETRSTLQSTMALVLKLLAESPPAVIGVADVERSWGRHGGNVREVFFELYDLYELRRS